MASTNTEVSLAITKLQELNGYMYQLAGLEKQLEIFSHTVLAVRTNCSGKLDEILSLLQHKAQGVQVCEESTQTIVSSSELGPSSPRLPDSNILRNIQNIFHSPSTRSKPVVHFTKKQPSVRNAKVISRSVQLDINH